MPHHCPPGYHRCPPSSPHHPPLPAQPLADLQPVQGSVDGRQQLPGAVQPVGGAVAGGRQRRRRGPGGERQGQGQGQAEQGQQHPRPGPWLPAEPVPGAARRCLPAPARAAAAVAPLHAATGGMSCRCGRDRDGFIGLEGAGVPLLLLFFPAAARGLLAARESRHRGRGRGGRSSWVGTGARGCCGAGPGTCGGWKCFIQDYS